MTARKGTKPFKSSESIASEEQHIQCIKDVIAELGADWSIKYSMTIEELIGKKPTYARLKGGMSQEWRSDGGYIFYKGNLKGVAENKWQEARENACERACRYFTFLKPNQLFVSTAGPGFTLKDGGGATGPLIDMLNHAGACVTENVDEQSFKDIFKNWALSLIEDDN